MMIEKNIIKTYFTKLLQPSTGLSTMPVTKITKDSGFIALLGCDGSGKSAVISKLVAAYKVSDIPVNTGHWRPYFGKKTNQSAINFALSPHAQSPRGTLSSLIKLLWITLNWWIAWITKLKKESNNGILLFDRFHGDLLCDPQRYRYGGPLHVARLWSKALPQPDLIIYLDADVPTLISRKQEVPEASLISLRQHYTNFIKDSKKGVIIDATQPLEDVVKIAIDHISKIH